MPTPQRRVTDHHGPELAALALANLRDRFPAAFAGLGVGPAPDGACCSCADRAVVTMGDGDGGRDSMCFRHAEEELESLEPEPASETTRDRSGHFEPWG
jgi:hypothetical protein